MFTVAAPRKHIWSTLNDYANYLRTYDGIERMEVRSRKQDTVIVEVWAKPAVRTRLNYTLRRVSAPAGKRLVWEQLSGDFEVNEGSWDIVPTRTPGVHLIVHRCFVKIGQPLADAFCNLFSARAMHASALKLRAWVEDSVRARPHPVRSYAADTLGSAERTAASRGDHAAPTGGANADGECMPLLFLRQAGTTATGAVP